METTLTLSGELDLATVPALREQMIAATEAGARKLVLDMREVSFMDSTALAAVINAKKRMGEGGEVTLVLPRDSYGRLIFEVTGLDGVLDVVETL
jgi:anti-sigma B factor antagonist